MLKQNSWIDEKKTDGLALCPVERFESNGTAWVRLPEGRLAPAKAITSVSSSDLANAAESQWKAVVGRVGESQEPIILGIVSSPKPPSRSEIEPAGTIAEVDGKRVVLTGQEEIVLRCGESSITLTKAGKIIIRGTYLSSRSSGVNRINGGSVQIN